ncbi:MAG: hypothetical protein Ct9H300mP11_23680 [Chloroflexota bacterium]|nr:MAG: hypothetical protein Ct9H300mP11_23680 [Chloroflexota bacterium]
MLRYIADINQVRTRYSASTGFLLSDQHPQKRCLAASLWTDDANTGSFIDIQIDTGEYYFNTVVDGQSEVETKGIAVVGTPKRDSMQMNRQA